MIQILSHQGGETELQPGVHIQTYHLKLGAEGGSETGIVVSDQPRGVGHSDVLDQMLADGKFDQATRELFGSNDDFSVALTSSAPIRRRYVLKWSASPVE